jgi:hypothetical protein
MSVSDRTTCQKQASWPRLMSLCAFATEIAGDPGPYCLSTTKSNRPIASSCACHHLVLFSLAMFMALAANVQAQTSPVLSVAGPTEIRFGDQPQYTALLDGASGSAVSWAVNGFVGGTGSTGPISASGVFSPASTIFAGHSVTISAKTGASPVTSASIMVRVLNPLPRITSGSIAQTVPGSFLLDVHGGGFVAASQLFVAGVTVSTIFVSSAELRSTIQLSAGTTAISAGVLNPNAEQKSLVSVNLPVPLPKLMVMPAGLSFGEVATQTAAVEPVTLSSSGQAPVIIQSGSLSGSGFSLTGATFPVTLNHFERDGDRSSCDIHQPADHLRSGGNHPTVPGRGHRNPKHRGRVGAFRIWLWRCCLRSNLIEWSLHGPGGGAGHGHRDSDCNGAGGSCKECNCSHYD